MTVLPLCHRFFGQLPLVWSVRRCVCYVCVMQVRCTTTSPVLLLLDNHDSHLSIEVLDYAKDHGIVMLSFPPHCSHRMQPLDRTVYGPFKKHYNSTLREWMVDNPGKPAGIYNIPALVAKAFQRAMMAENITSGFRVTGIFPHNADVFPEEAFLPAQVTDRPQPDDDQVSTAATADQLLITCYNYK